MTEVMTVEEMKERFDSEWILVADSEVNEHLEVVAGKVVWHSKDRDEVDRKLLELRPKSAATLYTGTMPEDTAIVL